MHRCSGTCNILWRHNLLKWPRPEFSEIFFLVWVRVFASIKDPVEQVVKKSARFRAVVRNNEENINMNMHYHTIIYSKTETRIAGEFYNFPLILRNAYRSEKHSVQNYDLAGLGWMMSNYDTMILLSSVYHAGDHGDVWANTMITLVMVMVNDWVVDVCACNLFIFTMPFVVWTFVSSTPEISAIRGRSLEALLPLHPDRYK